MKVVCLSLLFTLMAAGSGSCMAQGLFESATGESSGDKKIKFDFNGYGRGSAYGGSNFYDYSHVFAEFAFQGKVDYQHAFLFTDLRFRYGLRFDSIYPEFEMKETYAGYVSDKLDIYLGGKIVNWGRMDGFNPTDNITPYDYFFLSANPDDQKLPNFLLQTKWHITPMINFEALLIPFYRPSVYRFDLFDLGEFTTFAASTLPAKTFQNGSFGARFNFNLTKAGFSISWFRGYDPYYGFNIAGFSIEDMIPSLQLTATPYHKNAFGADLEVPIGSWVARAEIAYDLTKDYEQNMYIPNPGLNYVAGLEHSFGGVVTLLQYIGYYTFDFVSLDDLPPPETFDEMVTRELTEFNRKIFFQQERTNHAFSLSLSKSFRYETIRAELAGYYNFTSEEWFVRPEVTWKITDYLETSIGGFYSEGPDRTIYYYASDVLNGAFLELKVNF
jgi:hypothetical protein